MKLSTLLLLTLVWTIDAQPLPQGQAVKGIDLGDPSKLLTGIMMPEVHIHFPMIANCKGVPDHVYGDSKGVYYACISGQEICTVSKAHKGVGVPRALITQYEQVKVLQEAERQERERAQQARQEQLVREGRSTGDPALDLALSRQRLEAIANEAKAARAEGRRPNLAQFTQQTGAPPARSAQPASAPAIAVTTVPRATTALLPDEKLTGIATGAAIRDVQQKLGNPYLRISGGSESWTYRLESGGTAQLEFERGVLARLEIRPAAR